MRKAALQEGGNITRSLGYGYNLHRPRGRTIDNEVGTQRPKQNRIRSQIESCKVDVFSIQSGNLCQNHYLLGRRDRGGISTLK